MRWEGTKDYEIPMDLLLGKKFGLSNFIPGMVIDVFDQLDPAKCYITFLSKDHETKGVEFLTEPHYGLQYHRHKFSEEDIEDLR